MAETLRITEIYRSLQGESCWAGWPCVFVRLTGCSLRCVWCDTAHAFEGGVERSVDDVAQEVLADPTALVEITGGEPLEQEGFHDLARRLLDAGRTVLVETGGHVRLDRVDSRVVKIVDWKAPGSRMDAANDWQNLRFLQPHDEIKIVVAERSDFDWAVENVRRHDVLGRVRAISISPVWSDVALTEVASWIRDCGLPLRLNLQLHKVIWGDEPGR